MQNRSDSLDVQDHSEAEQHLKDALSKLEESESLLRSVIENAQHFGVYRIQVDRDNLYSAKVLVVSPSIGEMLGVDDPYRFENWFENLHPDDRPRVLKANRRSLKEGIPYNQPTRYFNKRQNHWLWVHTISNPGFDAQGRLTHFDGIVVDLTEQKEAELALQELNATLEQRVEERTHELERRREIAESLSEILSVLNSTRTSQEIFDFLTRRSCELLFADACFLYRIEDSLIVQESEYNLPFVLASLKSGELYPGKHNLDLLHHKPVAVNDAVSYLEGVLEDPDLKDFQRAWYAGVLANFKSYLGIPLIVNDQLFGGLGFYFKNTRYFTSEDIQLAQTLGGHCALAIENAMLRAQTTEMAKLSERSRLARDLHDAVSQTLFSVSLIADVLPKLWERNPEAGRQKLEELRQLTRGALSEMRTLLLELRPSSLVEMDVADLIRHLANAFAGRSRIPITVNTDGLFDPSSEIKEVIFRIVQESLNNVNKHAQASEAVIDVWRSENEIRLEIRDDGRGFDPQDVPPDSLGLSIMRERAESIGAQLEIGSSIGRGTRILLIWKGVQSD